MQGRLSLVLPVTVAVGFALQGPAAGQIEETSPRQQMLQEEARDYFERWLKQDVVYIITPEEREVFSSLTNDEERERFIEQFWLRRDPDPRTAVNEFREEHYRRIAYANERFRSGAPGWKTDRGRIYIIHGPPDSIEPHPSGGPYERPLWEGGGTTVTFPFEVWRYRRIPGVGEDIVLEFVDPAYSGEYRLAVDPDEKDAFAKVPTLGLTLDEAEGIASKAQRGTSEDIRYYLRRDKPFDRYYEYTFVQRPPQIKYRDLQELVKVNVTFDQIPFQVRVDQFRLNDDMVIVPITIEVANRDLSIVEENGRWVAGVSVYGLVQSVTNQVVAEFEDDLINTFSAAEAQLPRGRSVYQKTLVLERRLRYKMDLVLRDHHGGKTAVSRHPIIPRDFRGEGLAASSLMLSDLIRTLPEPPSSDEMFVIGDVLVRPALTPRFQVGQPVGVYFQLYHVALDQASNSPSLQVTWKLIREGREVATLSDPGDSIYYFSEARTVLIRSFPTQDLLPGRYRIGVVVEDRIGRGKVDLEGEFEVVAPEAG